MTEIIIDFTGVKPYRPRGQFNLVPDGEYEFVVDDTDIITSKTSGYLMVVAELQVWTPDLEATPLRDYFMLEGKRVDGRIRLLTLSKRRAPEKARAGNRHGRRDCTWLRILPNRHGALGRRGRHARRLPFVVHRLLRRDRSRIPPSLVVQHRRPGSSIR